MSDQANLKCHVARNYSGVAEAAEVAAEEHSKTWPAKPRILYPMMHACASEDAYGGADDRIRFYADSVNIGACTCPVDTWLDSTAKTCVACVNGVSSAGD